MKIQIQKPSTEILTYSAEKGDLLLILRQRETTPILGIFDEIYSQYISRDRGSGYEKRRLLLKPALRLEPCEMFYGKKFPNWVFRRELSFNLGSEIAQIITGKENIFNFLRTKQDYRDYADFLSHIPETGPYNPKEWYTKV